MIEHSFEKFDYTLRPAKNIERKMICEALARLSAISPLSRYRYVGFGSISFKDLALVHQRLGITDLVSVEGAEELRERFLFNKPYSCIRVCWGTATEVLPTLSWRKRAVVWLDYDTPLDREVLGDVGTVVGNVRSGGVLVVTVDAKPERLAGAGGGGTVRRRLAALRDQIGENRIPPRIRGSDLAKWGLAQTCREIIQNEIEDTLADRNAPLMDRWRLNYHQLFNFHYADRARMLTVGGYFVNRDDERRAPADAFSDLSFVRPGRDPCLIEVPVLTWREANYLDSRLPRLAPDVPRPVWLPEAERRKYAKIYKYFPTYLEAEL